VQFVLQVRRCCWHFCWFLRFIAWRINRLLPAASCCCWRCFPCQLLDLQLIAVLFCLTLKQLMVHSAFPAFRFPSIFILFVVALIEMENCIGWASVSGEWVVLWWCQQLVFVQWIVALAPFGW